MLNEAQKKASSAAAISTGVNSLITGSLNFTLKAGLQAPAVREQIKRLKLFGGTQPKFNVDVNNKVTPNIVDKTAKQLMKVFSPAIGEALEEGTQGGVIKAEQAV